MEAMLGISLNSYPYFNQQKCFVYTLSSTKLEKRTEQILPESDGGAGGKGRVQEVVGRNGQNNICAYE
jgi:hypothetical protein